MIRLRGRGIVTTMVLMPIRFVLPTAYNGIARGVSWTDA